MLNVAADCGLGTEAPTSREGWAKLAQTIGIKGIHIAERDTQRAAKPKPMGTFVNTWSVEGFVSEGLQPAELGWGTHEKELPPEGRRHEFGPDCAIRAPARACARGRRRRVPSTASSSRTTSRSRSPIT